MEDYPQFQLDTNNITVIVPPLINWLSGSGDYKDSFAYQTIISKISNEDEAKSFALRLIIHYVGDIHQPLHASSRVDSKYPKGDAGGNFFKVPSKDGVKNLHAVWDAGVYQYSTDPNLVSFTHFSNLYFSLSAAADGPISPPKYQPLKTNSPSLLPNTRTPTSMPGLKSHSNLRHQMFTLEVRINDYVIHIKYLNLDIKENTALP